MVRTRTLRWPARALAAPLLFAVSCTGEDPAPIAPAAPLRTVALITIDTLRADYVHAYGFPQATTPTLDALAARGVLFDRAIAAAASTIPSHASMMTGRYPRQQSTGARNGDTRLEGLPTVAERFSDAGWDTAAFVSNVVLQRRSGLDRGFQHYDERLPSSETSRVGYERIAGDTVDAALGWLGEHDGRNVFLWVHLQDPHGPYTPPAEWIERFEAPTLAFDPELEPAKNDRPRGAIPHYQFIEGVHRASEYARRYAAEIAYADAALGRLAAALSERGPLVLLVTSDHGESLGENDRFLQHGHSSTPELARVPMLLVAPGLSQERRGELVSHVDVAPTLLELAGLAPLPDPSGLALAVPERGVRDLPDRTVFCDAVGESSAYRLQSYVRISGFSDTSGARAIERIDAGDTGALQVSATSQAPDGQWRSKIDPQLTRELRRYLRAEVPVVPASLNAETLERLRQLGYLEAEVE